MRQAKTENPAKMKIRILLLAAALMAPASAHAASFTVPSFTLTGPPSTGTVCTPTAAASGPASSAPAGTVIFNCVVSPAGWVGGVALNSPESGVLNVVGLSGNTFNLALAAAGVAQTYPAGSGSTTP